jgi:hypothetical protein
VPTPVIWNIYKIAAKGAVRLGEVRRRMGTRSLINQRSYIRLSVPVGFERVR